MPSHKLEVTTCYWQWSSYTLSLSLFTIFADLQVTLPKKLFSNILVTKKLTAVHRTLVDALRTILVWGVDLFIYYLIDKNFGEEWNHYSYIQVLGFLLLLVGTMIYNAVIKLPCLYYEPTVSGPAMLREEKKPLLLLEEDVKNKI